jgi:hypothetical protein
VPSKNHHVKSCFPNKVIHETTIVADESHNKQKGVTVQATYFDLERKVVCHGITASGTTICVSGQDIPTNAQVNVASSILIASAMGGIIGPYMFHLTKRIYLLAQQSRMFCF